jgi:2-polyprenyl-3-methyl-5-hydroxy-6-metoxy-1,4-benzoquinol methylase
MEEKVSIDPKDWLEINRKSWETRTGIHVDSEFYNLETFKKTKNSLHSIELELLGDVGNQSLLHLQCHFGMDSLSLQELGAEVTGVDFSEKAIKFATTLAKELKMETTFICSNVYDFEPPAHHSFDTVFSSYGIVGWLPDLNEWAKIIHKNLSEKGRFILVDFHPALWMFNDDFNAVEYSYFNDKPYVENTTGTYTDGSKSNDTSSIWWSHSLSEITMAFFK